MKTRNKKSIIILLSFFMILGFASWSRAEESKTKSFFQAFHPYVELAPTFSIPVTQSDTDPFPIFGGDTGNRVDLGPGGGFQLGVGVDTKWIGVGTKGRLEFFESDSNFGVGGPQVVAAWDFVEVRLFVVDWFRQEPSTFRPYLLAGGGSNVNSLGLLGFQGNLGAGFQYPLTKHLYLGGEATYRPMFLGDKTTHNVGLAATIGVRF